MDELALRTLLNNLEASRSSLHGLLHIFIWFVVVGLALDLFVIIKEFRDGRGEFTYGRIHPYENHLPKRPNVSLLILALLGTALIVIGVAGELYVDVQAGKIETQIREANDNLLGLIIQEAGDARESATSAADASGKAQHKALDVELKANDLLQKYVKAERNIEELRARNLQLEEALSPRVIEQGRSAEELKKFKKVTFRIHTVHDIEPRRTAGQIMFLCSQGGWTYSKSFSSDRTAQFGEDFDGIFIEANVPSRGSDDLSWRAAELLRQVLSESKIKSMVIARLLPAHPPFPDGAIMVHVGMKPIVPLFLEKGMDKSDSKFIMRGNVMTIPE